MENVEKGSLSRVFMGLKDTFNLFGIYKQSNVFPGKI